jgi:cell division septation protein DedD
MKSHSNIVTAPLLVRILLSFLLQSMLFAQDSATEIKSYIKKLDGGETEQVKTELPELVSKYQNHPGIVYLQGRLASDGTEAIKFYQSIVNNFPKCEWADESLYRIYQYYLSLGLYRTAETKMQQLKKEYPSSIYANDSKLDALVQQNETNAKYSSDTINESKTEAQSTEIKADDSDLPFSLQVGAFSTSENAEKQRKFFEDIGHSVEITNKVRSGKSMYLVWIQQFKTAAEAQRFGKEIKSKYKIDSIVIERY